MLTWTWCSRSKRWAVSGTGSSWCGRGERATDAGEDPEANERAADGFCVRTRIRRGPVVARATEPGEVRRQVQADELVEGLVAALAQVGVVQFDPAPGGHGVAE